MLYEYRSPAQTANRQNVCDWKTMRKEAGDDVLFQKNAGAKLPLPDVVRQKGFEPPTFWFVVFDFLYYCNFYRLKTAYFLFF